MHLISSNTFLQFFSENTNYKITFHTRSKSIVRYSFYWWGGGNELSLASVKWIIFITWEITRPKCRVLFLITVVLVKLRICYRNLWEKLDGLTGYNKAYDTGVIISSILNNSSKNFGLINEKNYRNQCFPRIWNNESF